MTLLLTSFPAFSLVQFPRPEYVAADLSKVKLADALATTSFDPKKPTLFTIGKYIWLVQLREVLYNVSRVCWYVAG